MRPIIGITANEAEYEGIYLLKKVYAESIWQAGGIPVLLTPMLEDALSEMYVNMCQGIILTGGGDIDSAYFGEEPVPELSGISKLRDSFELSLTQWAWHYRVPILGICRGCQVMNVAAGGNIIQHLPQELHQQNAPRHIPTHEAKLMTGSILSSIYQTSSILVNSFHHQAVGERLGQGLVVTARAEDGVIEGIERPGDEFCVGVQWHPECLTDISTKRLFSHFIQCAAAHQLVSK